MELLNACPHHDYLVWKLADYFYEGLTLHFKQLLESVCNGEYMKKNMVKRLWTTSIMRLRW